MESCQGLTVFIIGISSQNPGTYHNRRLKGPESFKKLALHRLEGKLYRKGKEVRGILNIIKIYILKSLYKHLPWIPAQTPCDTHGSGIGRNT